MDVNSVRQSVTQSETKCVSRAARASYHLSLFFLKSTRIQLAMTLHQRKSSYGKFIAEPGEMNLDSYRWLTQHIGLNFTFMTIGAFTLKEIARLDELQISSLIREK